MQDIVFGARLRELREQLGATQLDISSASGVSRALVSQLENGNVPSLRTAIRVANTLSDLAGEFITLDWLTGRKS